jgi:ATP-dependent Lhr-like helicase
MFPSPDAARALADARGCRILYISPLKALAVDVERNLRAPIAGIANRAAARGDAFHLPAIAVRTGDTPSVERARFQRDPSDILITTPESLYLLLTSNAREALRRIETVIVDEIHALVPTKRGAHLALSLERLHALAATPPQRIGLSATQRPARRSRALSRGPAAPGAARVDQGPRRAPHGPGQVARRGIPRRTRSTTISAEPASPIRTSRSWTPRRRRSSN